uniref:Uncharacterized protein n=1 Tax=Leersia perrieri TaxID=77586 RepID=A0A0D9WNH3_9ORYZ
MQGRKLPNSFHRMPIRRTTLHMKTSIGRMSVPLRSTLPLPVPVRPRQWHSSSSGAADRMSILFPMTRNGTPARASSDRRPSSSFLDSANRYLSAASTINGGKESVVATRHQANLRRHGGDDMIHLRRCVLSHLLHPHCPAPANPLLSLHRLLSSAAFPISPKSFVVEDYLVESCGLTRAQAAKVSGNVSHLKSPSKPDAVLAFLSGLGLSRSDIALAVASDPRLLCAKVDKTLDTRVSELSELGMSYSQIARLIPLARSNFRYKSLGPKMAFLLTVFGSFDSCLEVLKMNSSVLSINIEQVIKPNLVVLQQCEITITNLPFYAFMSRVMCRPTKHLEQAVVLANKFGLKQGTRMFSMAVVIFAILSQEKLTKRLQLFKKLGWSQDDLSLAVKNMPNILGMKEETLCRNMKFLMKDVGLEIPYIARRPALLLYSFERRLLPRHCLINVLKEHGLVKTSYDYFNIAMISNDKFMDKFVHPYVESVPGLGDAYASGCAGYGVHQLVLLSKDKRMS